MSWIRQQLHSNRPLRFLLIHAAFSVAVGVWIIRNLTPNAGPVFPRYFIAFVEAFLGSIGFAFLSLVFLVKSFFLGYGNTGALNLGGHIVPLPVAAGAAAFFAFFFLWIGMRVYNRMLMTAVLAASSLLLFAVAHLYLHMPNVTDHLLGL